MTLLKLVRRVLFPPWVRFLNKSLRAYRKLSAINHELKLTPLDSNPLRGKKSSDTFFILGSGASVLTYTEREWETIARHDSLGFNFWILHPFVPTHYMFELFKDINDPILKCIRKNLIERTDVTSKTSIFIKDAERIDADIVTSTIKSLPSNQKNPITILWDADIPGSDIFEFTDSLKSLSHTGCFSGGRYWAIPRNRASVFFAINLAVRAGYKKIVLCGVDLNNTKYFYESDSYVREPNLCIPPNVQPGVIHKTNDLAYGEMTISSILDIFDRIVLQPRGIVLSVAKSTSALYPRFKEYFSS